MQLQTIRSQIAQLKAQLPPPKGKPPVFVFASKLTGEPAEGRQDTETYKYWQYRDLGELQELRDRFDRELGPATRGPNDPPCLFFRVTSAEEIFEEQYKGTPYESLWMGGPLAESVQW
jgi:hypothetical protein